MIDPILEQENIFVGCIEVVDLGIAGVAGPIGPQGPSGPSGIDGEQGAIGPQGPQGIDGLVGPIGLTGPQGEAGPIGAVGPKGDTGAIGPQGPIGLTGQQGQQGIKGDTGAKGDIGLTGPKGDQGSQGPQGIQGPQGLKGDVGESGIDQQEISGNVTATEAMRNKVLIVTANTTFTISNTILSKDWTVRVIVINGILDIVKGSTRVFELGNPELNLEKGSDVKIRQRASTANLIITGEFLNNPFIAIFETRNTLPGGSNANQLTIRTGGTGVVDWGNGDREPLAGILTKTYDKEGAKTIKIYSQSFLFSQTGVILDSNKITEVLNYGGLQIGANVFTGCAYLNMEGAKGIPNLTTSLLNAFSNTQRMKKINNLEYADFSTITTLKNTFQNSKINQPMGFINVSNVTDFGGMMTFKTPADFSTDNYDGILNGWSERKFAVTNHAFSFGSIKHTSASSQSKLLWTRPNIVVPITNAVNNGSGLIRVTAIAHGMATGNKVFIADVVGGMGINRAWTVTVIDINTVDLQGSAFVTAYVSGGGLRTGWGHVLTDGGI